MQPFEVPANDETNSLPTETDRYGYPIIRGTARRSRFGCGYAVVSLLLVATLAALIVPRLVSRECEACQAPAKADIATLSSAIQQFRIDVGRYPTDDEGLRVLVDGKKTVRRWNGPYVERVPLDPWQHPYIYENDGDSFLVTSYGEDGKPGGDGADADITSRD